MRHGLVQLGPGHRPHGGRDSHGNQSPAGADGGLGSQHRGPTVAHAAPQDIAFSIVPLVGIPPPPGQGELLWEDPVEVPANLPDQVGRDTDASHDNPAGSGPALPQQEAGLGQGKGDGGCGLHRHAQDLPGIGLHPAGEVHRQGGCRTGIHELYCGQGQAPEFRIQANAEEGVHQHAAAGAPSGLLRASCKVL